MYDLIPMFQVPAQLQSEHCAICEVIDDRKVKATQAMVDIMLHIPAGDLLKCFFRKIDIASECGGQHQYSGICDECAIIFPMFPLISPIDAIA